MSQGVVDLFNQLAQNDFGFFQRVGSIADIMTRDVRTLSLDDTYEDAVAFFARNRFHHAPVIEEGEVVGIVSDRDVLRFRPPLLGSAAEGDKDHLALTASVARFMTRGPIAVRSDAPPEAALSLMLEHHIDSVLVHDERRQLEGIVTPRDFMQLVLLFHRVCTSAPDLVRFRLVDLDMSRGLPLDLVFSRGARSVRDVMTRQVESLTAADKIKSAIELMQSREVRHIPIVDDAQCVIGLVTDRDILRILPSPDARPETKVPAKRFRERLFATDDRRSLEAPVSTIMTREPATVRPDTLFVDAINAMLKPGISGLPVVASQKNDLCGILTMTEVLRTVRVVMQIGSLLRSDP